jgi:hypothetical protein
LHVLKREISDCAFKAAMDPMSGSTTHRTKGGRRDPFTSEDQTFGLSAREKQAKTAKTGKEDMLRQSKERNGNTLMNTP